MWNKNIKKVPHLNGMCYPLFFDGNKRTAVIFANHYMISHGLGIIVIPTELVDEYKKLLVLYYEDKDIVTIKEFLKEKCVISF